MKQPVKPDAPAVAPKRPKRNANQMRQLAAAIRADKEQAKQPPPVNPYRQKPPKPWPGVLPPNGIAMDADLDLAQSLGFAAQFGDQYGEGLGFLGYTYLAELAQRPEYRRFSEVMADEMTRKWIRITSTSEDKQDTRIKLINQAFDKFKVKDIFRQLAEVDGLYGRANLYVDMGQLSAEVAASPLVLDSATVPLHSLKGFKVIEPFWTYPARYNATDPTHPDFYRPPAWYCMGKTYHGSRFLPFVGREVPDILKPIYCFGGLSLSQMAKPYVDNWIRTRQNVADLVESFSVSGLKTDLDNALTGGSGDDLDARLMLYNAIRSSRGMMAIDKNTEEFFNVSTPLGTLDKLQAQSQEQMCSVTAIPLVKFTGITPSGLNASSDGEIEVFADTVSTAQNRLYDPHMKFVLDLIMLSELGAIHPDITYTWEPLKQVTEQEREAMRKTRAETFNIYDTAGVLDAADERRRLALEEDGLYQGIDPDDLPVPPPQPGDMPGAPGQEDDQQADNDNTPHPEIEHDLAANDIALDADFKESGVKRDEGGKFAKSVSMREALSPDKFASPVTQKYLGAKHKQIDAARLHADPVNQLQTVKAGIHPKYPRLHGYVDQLLKEHGAEPGIVTKPKSVQVSPGISGNPPDTVFSATDAVFSEEYGIAFDSSPLSVKPKPGDEITVRSVRRAIVALPDIHRQILSGQTSLSVVPSIDLSKLTNTNGTGSKLTEAGGIYRQNSKKIEVSREYHNKGIAYESNDVIRAATHELGHALDAALAAKHGAKIFASSSSQFKQAIPAPAAQAGASAYFFQNPEEVWAECYAAEFAPDRIKYCFGNMPRAVARSRFAATIAVMKSMIGSGND